MVQRAQATGRDPRSLTVAAGAVVFARLKATRGVSRSTPRNVSQADAVSKWPLEAVAVLPLGAGPLVVRCCSGCSAVRARQRRLGAASRFRCPAADLKRFSAVPHRAWRAERALVAPSSPKERCTASWVCRQVRGRCGRTGRPGADPAAQPAGKPRVGARVGGPATVVEDASQLVSRSSRDPARWRACRCQ